jgi:hypothetical protein
MSIADNLDLVKKEIPSNVTLVAVSKTKPAGAVQEAYDAGHKTFGESRVQELMEKYESLPKDIAWHMIGHLQRNKVKYIVPFVHLIHSVDSPRLLSEINKQAEKANKIVDCLLQAHIAEEESKFGFSADELTQFLNSDAFTNMQYVRIKGLMGMATFTSDENLVRKEFQFLYQLHKNVKNSHFKEKDFFSEISMGMSGDYKLAIEEGSTMVRVGSRIFGSR